jgi:hypothetical protein
MKIQIAIECDCGITGTINPKRTTHAHEDGRVYEDYSSISDGVNEDSPFKVKDQPDGVYIICKSCGKSHDLI